MNLLLQYIIFRAIKSLFNVIIDDSLIYTRDSIRVYNHFIDYYFVKKKKTKFELINRSNMMLILYLLLLTEVEMVIIGIIENGITET